MPLLMSQVAGISRPLVSTILEVDEENFLRKSLIRNDHKASETPQAFQYRLLCSAYEKVSLLAMLSFVTYLCSYNTLNQCDLGQ